MRIANALGLLRSFKGLTQQDIAKKAGISRGLLAQLETGAANPSWNSLQALSIAFEMPLSSMIQIAELLEAGYSPELPEIQNLLVKK